MEILHDQRKTSLAEIGLARLADGAGGRVGPERLIVGAAIVVTGEAKQAGDPENQQRGRERQKAGEPGRLGTEPGVRRIAEDLRGVERRDVGPVHVVGVSEMPPNWRRPEKCRARGRPGVARATSCRGATSGQSGRFSKECPEPPKSPPATGSNLRWQVYIKVLRNASGRHCL